MAAVLVPVLAMVLVLAPVPVSAVLESVPVSAVLLPVAAVLVPVLAMLAPVTVPAVLEPAVLLLAVPVLRPPQPRQLPQRLGRQRPSES